jgi:hypothetical protein
MGEPRSAVAPRPLTVERRAGAAVGVFLDLGTTRGRRPSMQGTACPVLTWPRDLVRYLRSCQQ